MNKLKVIELITHLSVTISKLGDALVNDEYIDVVVEEKKDWYCRRKWKSNF